MPDQQGATWASRPRTLLAAVLAVLLLALVVLWSVTQRRDLDPPLMITPALGATPSPTAVPPAPSVVPSSRPPSSRPATRKVSASKSARPAKTPSRRPSASPTPKPAFTARYLSGGERRGQFQAGIVIENEGDTARNWQVRVTYHPDAEVRVERTFGADASTSGSTVVFSGGPLAAGRSTMIGFRASTEGDGEIRPTSCQVDGRACEISSR
ncbi:cellulose binding domain-containing protein [Jidongwangia harbinensis]|uniref:cellulose binding domain-containing protein n=1 Tax=Jidongwangia harbinensis TaxID=2878561 RepID=UPI001CD97794|nr:cellulose binding domain-containing protein [Jidongwangia harbinensis]MCA2215544.1 cellulose binding domain-containing protein [Jidongwangia harbinensis]